MIEMPTLGYAANVLLVASVLRQLRGRRLTWVSLGWPIVLVLWAGITYVHGTSTAGNNTVLIVFGTAAGAVLGAFAGGLSLVYTDQQNRIMVRATRLAALLWVVGTAGRLAFELYAEHGGYPEITAFDRAHRITSTRVWATSLVLMALAEVLARTVFLAPRLWTIERGRNCRDAVATPVTSGAWPEPDANCARRAARSADRTYPPT
jgi:hypothetical protein